MDKQSVITICTDANERLIIESLSGFPKYKYLPQWLFNQSIYLKNDRLKQKKNFKVFKRGTIVYIDFGINVGNELSGNHFAIVLNNFDNKNNGLLTVVPTSSKKKTNYVPVGIIIGLQSIKHVIRYSEKQQEKLQILVLAALSTGLLNEESLPEPLNEISAKRTLLTNEEILRMAKDSNLLCTTNRELSEKTQQLLSNIRQSRKVFEIYTRYTKESYIMPSNIQTISKYRIKRLNKLDPVGDIKASSEILNKIDQAIRKRFAK